MANPYLPDQANAITTQVTNNLNRNILPGMRRGSVASGGWGNSGQGIAQGLAVGETNQGLSNSLSSLYGSAWDSDQNRATQTKIADIQSAAQLGSASLNADVNRYKYGNDFVLGLGGLSNQRYGMDQDYNLGLGGLQNQATGMNQNFYTQQRGQDLQQQQQGYGQYLDSMRAQMGIGGAQTAIGDQQYNASLNPLQAFGSGLNPFTGLNNSRTDTGPQTGGGLAGAAGGALTAAQLWKLLNGGG